MDERTDETDPLKEENALIRMNSTTRGANESNQKFEKNGCDQGNNFTDEKRKKIAEQRVEK